MSLRDQGSKRGGFRLIDNRKDFDVMSNVNHGRGGISMFASDDILLRDSRMYASPGVFA